MVPAVVHEHISLTIEGRNGVSWDGNGVRWEGKEGCQEEEGDVLKGYCT